MLLVYYQSNNKGFHELKFTYLYMIYKNLRGNILTSYSEIFPLLYINQLQFTDLNIAGY